ncbi:MFS transporter [Pseudooceanicola sediminis]|nr:MFS transporter [Pseudooceanicola sediminis]|tara:strand:- start:41127 stop:41726 length:600 start_codon:yes stop_codon:yes gene_type:complete
MIGSLFANTSAASVIMSVLAIGPPYLFGALGLGAAAVGLVVSVGPVIAALSGVPAGLLVDRFGPRRMIVMGLGCMTLGLVSLALTSLHYGLAGYGAAMCVLTPSYQVVVAANNMSVMSGVEEDQRGAISGVLTLSRSLALTTGASMMGAIFVYSLGASDVATASPGDIASGMRTAFLIAAVLTLFATLIAKASHPARPK